MKLLDRRDVLPLRDFVCIDLDRIREALPEHPQYVAADPERAGLLTQAEAGTIGEVATEEAFRRGRHVWIDSTLRDGGWWSREIARIRATYPRYKLAILLVEASWPRVLHRSRRRSETTGRGIPEPILRSVFEQARARDAAASSSHYTSHASTPSCSDARLRVPSRQVPGSVALLKPLVDLFAAIDNDSRAPKPSTPADESALQQLCTDITGRAGACATLDGGGGGVGGGGGDGDSCIQG